MNKDILEKEYSVNHKTDLQIAKEYDYCQQYIYRLRKQYGIKRNFTSIINDTLNDEQKEMIYGTILGDGYIDNRGILQLSHCYKQKDYLLWFYNKLSSHSTKPTYLSDRIRFRTRSLQFLKNIRKELYINGIKTINRQFLDKLTPLSLAIWYCDDGMLQKYKYCKICTNSWNENQHQIIMEYFHEKWKLETYIAYNGKYLLTAFNKENSSKFGKLIKPHMIPSMCYKLPMEIKS